MLKKLIKKHNSRRMTNARPAAKCYSQLRQIKSHQDECLASQATETVADTAYLAFGVRVSRWAKCFISWKPGDGIFCISFFSLSFGTFAHFTEIFFWHSRKFVKCQRLCYRFRQTGLVAHGIYESFNGEQCWQTFHCAWPLYPSFGVLQIGPISWLQPSERSWVAD